MSLRGTAQETLRIVRDGAYLAPSGRTVSIGAAVDAARLGTVLVRPRDLLQRPDATQEPGQQAVVEVTEETTLEAARRLAANPTAHIAALNFASAKSPGGGFLSGARAQEEDLARASALYECLVMQRPYYDIHRASSSMLYTDHVIYSPAVPFFRDHRLELLEEPFHVSIMTCAAPNAGEALRRDPSLQASIAEALEQRARVVLEVAATRGHRTVVLGAWGCGVFRNDPSLVADVFARWLGHRSFAGAFDRVVFAVFDRSPRRENLAAFRARFGEGPGRHPPGRCT